MLELWIQRELKIWFKENRLKKSVEKIKSFDDRSLGGWLMVLSCAAVVDDDTSAVLVVSEAVDSTRPVKCCPRKKKVCCQSVSDMISLCNVRHFDGCTASFCACGISNLDIADGHWSCHI